MARRFFYTFWLEVIMIYFLPLQHKCIWVSRTCFLEFRCLRGRVYRRQDHRHDLRIWYFSNRKPFRVQLL